DAERTPRRAEQDLVLDGERRATQAHLGLAELRVGLPNRLARVLVGRDDAGRIIGNRDDEVAPERNAAIGELPLLLRIHAPDDTADVAGGCVDLVDDAPGIHRVEEAILGERRRLAEFVAAAAAKRDRVGELEALDVAAINAIERRIALAVIGAMVHEP